MFTHFHKCLLCMRRLLVINKQTKGSGSWVRWALRTKTSLRNQFFPLKILLFLLVQKRKKATRKVDITTETKNSRKLFEEKSFDLPEELVFEKQFWSVSSVLPSVPLHGKWKKKKTNLTLLSKLTHCSSVISFVVCTGGSWDGCRKMRRVQLQIHRIHFKKLQWIQHFPQNFFHSSAWWFCLWS